MKKILYEEKKIFFILKKVKLSLVFTKSIAVSFLVINKDREMYGCYTKIESLKNLKVHASERYLFFKNL